MKKSTKILLFVGIIVIAVAISFYIGRSLGEKEYFTAKRNKKDSYHRSMTNNAKSKNAKFKTKSNNANLFKNMTEEYANKHGINKETFKVIQDVFKNNEGPEKMIDIIKNNPKQGKALQTFILKNSM